MRSGLLVAGLVIGLAGCSAAATPSVTASAQEGALRYVALGDSYTIGTSVSSAESWPSQLAAREPGLDLVANLGVNGYTSADLIADELPRLGGLAPDFVTVKVNIGST